MSKTLLRITEDMEALEDLLIEAGGDVSDPAVAAALDEIEGELGSDLKIKVDGYVGLIRELELRASVRKAEAERLQKRVRVDDNAVKGLKGRLLYVLGRLKVQKVETDRFRVSIAKNGGKRPLTVDPGPVPDAYMVQPPPVVDKDKIRADLEAGTVLPFARLEDRGVHLSIR